MFSLIWDAADRFGMNTNDRNSWMPDIWSAKVDYKITRIFGNNIIIGNLIRGFWTVNNFENKFGEVSYCF